MAFKPFSIFLTLALWSLSATQLLSSAAPTQTNTTHKLVNAAHTNSSDPCNLLRYTNAYSIPAKDAYACLLSPQFNQSRSKNVFNQIRKFSHLHATQAFYKTPPTGPATIKFSPVDLNRTLDAIEKNIDGGAYRNEYEFTKDLSNAFAAFHDGHTNYFTSCAMVFGDYYHNYPLISIVDAETDEQKFYVFNTTTGVVHEEIVEIAGQPAVQYLLGLLHSLKGPWDNGFSDEDTRWNDLFASRGVHNDRGTFAAQNFYPEDFTMKTRSGQVLEVEWYVQGPLAWPEKNRYRFQMFNSTETLYKKWCLATTEATPASNSSNAVVPAQGNMARYSPAIQKFNRLQRRQNFNTNWRKSLSPRDINSEFNITDVPPQSYPRVDKRMKGSEQTLHLMDAPHNDVAVWGIHMFDKTSQNWDSLSDMDLHRYWVQYIIESLQLLKDKGIKRLVFDLSSNPGGMVFLGQETFRIFFPSASPFYGIDYRRSPVMDALNFLLNSTAVSTKLDGSSWKDTDEMLNPPVEKQGDYFTKIQRLNPLVNPMTWETVPQITEKPPFQQENVVILTDGRCSSTCVIFVEAMKSIGVATVVTGGKPAKEKPKRMQPVGGTKGYMTLPYSSVSSWTNYFNLSGEYLVEPVDTNVDAYMNIRNSYTADEQTIPQEFIFQPADAHLWYTKEMVSDRTNLWNEVVKLTWDERGNNKLIKSNFNNNTTLSH